MGEKTIKERKGERKKHHRGGNDEERKGIGNSPDRGEWSSGVSMVVGRPMLMNH